VVESCGSKRVIASTTSAEALAAAEIVITRRRL
jgi:hypothetical protein